MAAGQDYARTDLASFYGYATDTNTHVLETIDISTLVAQHKYARLTSGTYSMESIERADNAFRNGLIADGLNILLSAYQSTHEWIYLEVACELADNQIDNLAHKYRSHYAAIKPSLQKMRNFHIVGAHADEEWDKPERKNGITLTEIFQGKLRINPIFYAKNIPRGQIEIANDVCEFLTGEAQTNAMVCFLPAIEVLKNKVSILEQQVALRMSEHDSQVAMEKLIQMESAVKKQREIILALRTGYITQVMVLPRISLGDILVYAMKYDQAHVGTLTPGVNQQWVEKLELLFNNDNGVFIAQSEQSARLLFKKLVERIKNTLGKSGYIEFQSALELLSNNREGGSAYWWPEFQH